MEKDWSGLSTVMFVIMDRRLANYLYCYPSTSGKFRMLALRRRMAGIIKLILMESFGGWELYIKVRDEYSPNFLGFGDTFVFHPNGEYSHEAYGGILMTFDNGEWGYYVE